MLVPALRFAMTSVYRARRLVQTITGRRPIGVHGVVLTAAGEVVLVRLTYAPGWQLPGGGCRRGERPSDGLLRELREEIGLRAWGTIDEVDTRRPACMMHPHGGIFIVRGAVYRPRWSLEIAEVRAFAPTDLPDDLTAWTRAVLDRAA